MASARTLGFALVLVLLGTTFTGCLGLAMQRETMEWMRDEPIVRNIEVTDGWDHTFESSGVDSVLYTDEMTIAFDDTVSKLVINFRAQMPYSTAIEELIGNETNEYRYVDVKLWQPGVRENGGNPLWHIRATQDHPLERIDTFTKEDFIPGNWVFEVEARGYGITAPIDQLSFHDHFDVYATITKPCVYFAESHEIGDCTYLSDLQSR